MTVSTLAVSAADRHPLLPALDAATRASREAHEAAWALTDTVLACQYLPAEIYQYAPHLSQAIAALTSASRALTTATGYARTNPGGNLHALHRATTELTAATAALRTQTAALANAAAWFARPPALIPSTPHPL